MKNNLNVIQIRGLRGLIFAVMIGCFLVAGFVVFPGWLCMQIWNALEKSFAPMVPMIGIYQGIVLWAIIAISYMLFRKNKVVICFKSPEGLSEDELKSIFNDVKRQAQTDAIIQAMKKAREAELKTENKDIKTEFIESKNIESKDSTHDSI